MPTTPQTTLVLTSVAKLLFILLFLACSDANGASLRGSRLKGSELEAQQSPDADMLKAMQYIKGLHQGSHLGEEDEEPEEEEEEPADRNEELLQAVLSTLQQTEKAPRPKIHSSTSHRKIPLMFEDDEEEGGEEEEPEPQYESQFKRTNENVEEKYTPQNLATLQSVFDELNKIKRGEEEEEEDEDIFDLRRAYDDNDEEEEGEEEEERRREKVRRAFDNSDEEADEGLEEERPRDADDVANLMDYYLLKVLEKTEEEQQKRDEEEEEEEQERSRRGEDADQQLLYQLLTISQRYQIRPEDLVDLLSSGNTQQKSFRPHSRISEVPHQVPKEKLYRRPPLRTHKTPEEVRTEEILRILGLGDEEETAPREKAVRFPGRSPGHPTRPTGGLAYLANQMFANHPKPAFSSRKTHQNREVVDQNENSSFERRMEEYFGLMDSDKKTDEKRETEEEEKEEESPSEVMIKLLSLLNPEEDAKTVT